nr:putative RNA-directed DNA polymerase [Tanacetum cinerariifolium]
MGDTISQTRSENVSKFSNDSLLARFNTPQSDEDSLKLKELMELCTTLQSRVLALEQTTATQANKIDSLKRRVKKLKKKQRSRTYKLKRLYKVGLTAMVESFDDNEDLDLHGEEVFVAKQLKFKEKAQQVKEANISLIKTWDDIQAKVDADYQLAERLQAEEQQELNDEEKATLFIIQELFDKAMKRVNTFVYYKTELVVESSNKAKIEVTEGSSKRAGKELEQENAKKLKVVWIFLAFAAHMNMIVYQMDVKTKFLNGILREEVYGSQSNGFVDPDNPIHVYRLKKLYLG